MTRLKDRPPPDHGTRARYQLGCGCAKCSRANSDYQAGRRREVGRPDVKGRGLPYVGPYEQQALELDD